ncbi:MAG: tetraacyldisaccharide 4'-kinase [Leptolyngbya sp.]|nr:tetraacyldisaccharide 4'-kinase [Candidatus Melainabacteria bacterium]
MSWGNPESGQEKLVAGLLSPISLGYGIGSYVRLKAYSQGYIKRVRLPIPVVSVGNITCGGTGKTPMAIDISRRLIAAGYRVAILSRGYGRKSKKKTAVVSDGKGTFASIEDSGDEPLLIARSVPEAIVIVGSSRAESADVAINEYGADAIVLDDGFQHIKIERDIDLVLIDYNDEPDKDSLLPAGRLREPLSALIRAKVVVITKIPQNPDEEKLENLRRLISKYATRAEIAAARFVPKHLKTHSGTVSIDKLKGQRVIGFCGVARPESFARTLESLGCEVVDLKGFSDHHWYSPEELTALEKHMRTSNASAVVTTEKDMIKIPAHDRLNQHLIAVEMGVEWLGPLPVRLSEMMRGKLESDLRADQIGAISTDSTDRLAQRNSFASRSLILSP